MTATIAEPEARRCWILVYPDGESVDLDGEVHYASDVDAAKDAPRYTNDSGAPTPEQLDEACVSIACSCCGTVFDEDGNGAVEHHPTVESARSVAVLCGWTLAEDGTQKCEPCSGDCDCQDDAEAASAEGESR
ncbi:hypothetical protein [Sphaerisporangium sp. TRM90804]|uniref:hypothetical protein n=1 Tax=Sphaerisporangium sp. TRM90804 TaxID=3031113 RepID=UPI002449BA71|nr:hypothetical protein [Sphaerisporangium sp. TRM90804]MDH2424806.1 hypothetical protein [Sphaerisporangium sp. TRM90804]